VESLNGSIRERAARGPSRSLVPVLPSVRCACKGVMEPAAAGCIVVQVLCSERPFVDFILATGRYITSYVAVAPFTNRVRRGSFHRRLAGGFSGISCDRSQGFAGHAA
jgi:hypothetical protein